MSFSKVFIIGESETKRRHFHRTTDCETHRKRTILREKMNARIENSSLCGITSNNATLDATFVGATEDAEGSLLTPTRHHVMGALTKYNEQY